MARKDDVIAVRLAVALLLAGWTHAQNTNTNNNNNNQQTTATQPTTAATQQTTAQQPQQTTNQQQTQQTTNTPATNTQSTQRITASSNANTNTQTTTARGTLITGVPNGSTTSSTTAGTFGGISDVPTIAGYGIPTMIVPWTAGAPFMAKSSMPEGTVFIAVGALLGVMGAAVLVWRAVVAWSLHRSVKRANEKLMGGGNFSSQKLTKAGFTQSSLALGASNMSLDHLSAPQRNLKRNSMGTTTSAARNSSLFFSPTAPAGHQPSGTYSSINRSSGMLPSGFYAAPGAAAPGSTTIGGNSTTRSIYGRTSQYNVSPPDSPRLPPSRGTGGPGMYNAPSTSTLNLNIPGNAHPGGRAPSANLDDLFGHDPAAARR